MHYSSWAQNFPGLISSLYFVIMNTLIKDDTLLQLMVSSHCVISMQICQKFENKTNSVAPEGLSLLHYCVLASKKCLAPNKGFRFLYVNK